MKFRAVVVALVCLLGLLVPMGSSQAATLDIRGGKLFGATGVVFGGKTYDVEFVDGSCVTLYNGCDSVDDFDFADLATATLAAQALSDQVVIDVPGLSFDTDVTLTNGCTASIFCIMFIPTTLEPNDRVSGRSFSNIASFAGSDFLSFTSTNRAEDMTSNSAVVYAQFTQVPVPAALPLMLGGLALMGLVGRRRRG